MSDRTQAQRMQDDEDHRQAMCGLTPDERFDWERQDREYQHNDFIFAPGCGTKHTAQQPMPPEREAGAPPPGGHDWEDSQERPVVSATPLSTLRTD